MRGKNLFRISGDEYHTDDGHIMKREYGLTPNGNQINGRWVLRSPDNSWIDVDRYSSDLAERHGFTITYIPGQQICRNHD